MATKTSKTTSKKADAKMKNLEKILETANNVNKQVMETTSEVISDVLEQGVVIGDKVFESVKSGISFEKVSIKEVAGNVNEFVFETTEDVTDATLKTIAKYQGLGEKTLKNGLKLVEKQQDIVFDALDNLKGQWTKGVDRFNKLYRGEN